MTTGEDDTAALGHPAPRVTILGAGEAFDPDRTNTSVLYRGARVILCDCGPGVPRQLWRLTRDPDLLDGIFVSHAHADHTFGLPRLLFWLRDHGRTRPLPIFGGPGLDGWLARLLDVAYAGATADALNVVPTVLPPGAPRPLGPLTLTTAESRHRETNVALRVDEAGGAFCYSGDGGPTAMTTRLYRGSDLLVHECYGLAPHDAHASLDELLALEAKHLCLVHIGVTARPAVTRAVAALDHVVVGEASQTITVGLGRGFSSKPR